MAVYAIGDLQGCLSSFLELLDKLAIGASDKIWLTGDLVNRGPQSLETLRTVKGLGEQVISVLGNHDLHLLALAAGRFTNKPNPTLQPILHANDRDELLDWLRHRPLFHVDDRLGWAMVHAGIHPRWNISTAAALARETEAIFQGADYQSALQHMYGNHPDNWDDALTGEDRLRFVINAFTRMRFCFADGQIDFLHKGAPGSQGDLLMPWFDVPGRLKLTHKLVFGHWSALGLGGASDCVAIDTGCLWGGTLTAIRLDAEDSPPVSVECPQNKKVHS